MWEKISDVNGKREYKNPVTGSQLTTSWVYQDKDGNDWYAIDNLFTLPFMRQFAATKISCLYQIGLSKDDMVSHINNLKNTLRGTDPEKYDKAMSFVIDFENKMNDATNAIKQISSLVCVYNLLGDERVDIYDLQVQDKKMKILEADPDAQSFFLRRQIERTETYGNHLDLFSKTASAITKDISDLTGLKRTEPQKPRGTFS
jgi:hypothetical protein